MSLFTRITLLSLVALLLAPLSVPALAQGVIPIDTNNCGFFGRVCTGDETFDDLKIYFRYLINVAISLIGVTAFGFLVYAAFKYVTSQGEQEASNTAKRQITFALVGLFVAGAAGSIIAVIDYNTAADAIGRRDIVSLATSLDTVIRIIRDLISVVAFGFIVHAAFKYVTSQGDQEAAATAKRQITYALFGIIVAWGAWLLIMIITTANQNNNYIWVDLLQDYIRTYIELALEFVAVIAGAFLVFAGFKYITSGGDAEVAATAKRQIVYAILGIVIAGLALLIVQVVIGADPNDTTSLIEDIRTIMNRFLSLGAVITAAYMVLSGFMYIFASGEEERVVRAKAQFWYAIIGLIIIIISGVVINFIIQPFLP